MTIHVSPLSATRVLVVRTPSIAARIVYGARPQSDLAVRRPHGWCWAAQDRGWVGLQLEAEIDDALQEQS